MTIDDARQILKDTILHIDLVNLGKTISALGEDGLTWKTFDNSKWRPNKELAIKEMEWLAKNADEIFQALKTFKENRNDTSSI
jgi:hypothetical protein